MRSRSSFDMSWSSSPWLTAFSSSSLTCPRVSFSACRNRTGLPPLALSFCRKAERVMFTSTCRGTPSFSQ